MWYFGTNSLFQMKTNQIKIKPHEKDQLQGCANSHKTTCFEIKCKIDNN